MPIKVDEYDNIAVITVTGDLSGDASAEVRKAVEQTIDTRQIVNFVIDLEKSQFVDSDGLSAILWVRKKVEEMFGQVKLVNLDENIKKILEITRLDHRFECPGDLAAALKTMR